MAESYKESKSTKKNFSEKMAESIICFKKIVKTGWHCGCGAQSHQKQHWSTCPRLVCYLFVLTQRQRGRAVRALDLHFI